MQKFLIGSWQRAFNSSFAFVGVQLAGYIVDPRAGPLGPEQPGLFEMRLQQEHGASHAAESILCIDRLGPKSTATVVWGD
jgi:hypothetical protein